MCSFILEVSHNHLLAPLEEVGNNPVNDQTTREVETDPADEQRHDDFHDFLLFGLGIRCRYLCAGHLVLNKVRRNSRQDRHDINRIGLTEARKP